MKKTLLIAAALFTAVSPVMAGGRLSGAGASFPSKIYTRWFADLAKEKGAPRVNYQAVGSGSGRKAFIDETVNFGASDDPMKDKDIAKVTRGLVQIPMTGGTIAFGYNNPDCDLNLHSKKQLKLQWDKSLTGLNLDVMTKNLLGLTDQMDQAQLRHSQTQCKRSQKHGH